jgi:hypothetical protein
MFRSFASRRVLVAFVSAVLSLVVAAGVVLARAPLAGTADYNWTRRDVLTYKYSGTYDGWAGAKAAVDQVLEVEFSNRAYNDSSLPTFQYASDGDATVYFTSAAESPCSDIGNTSWLACASNWGSKNFRIYVREFAASGKSNWVWNETGNCTSGKTCWDLSRSLIHEGIHVLLGVGGHDESGESKTVMSAIQIAKSTTGWNTNHFQPCDEATAQLFYDVRTASSRYSKCMADVADTPNDGLTTSLTLDRTSATVCTAYTVAIKGLLKVVDLAAYKALGGNPLSSRVVYVDRRVAGGTWAVHKSVTTSHLTDWNFTVSLGNAAAGTYEYRFRFPETDGTSKQTDGVAASSDTVTIYWKTSPCPV